MGLLCFIDVSDLSRASSDLKNKENCMKHTEVLPSLGETIEEGEVEEWMVEVGDEVENGEPILVVGTDKASLEINATASGVFTQKLVGVGDMVKVGAAVAEIESEG